MPEYDAGNHLAPNVYLQNIFAIVRGDMIWFTLQLEVYDEGAWHPVLRCDTAHNEAHLDSINPQGETYHKQWLDARIPFNSTYTQLVNEFKTTYETHITRWYRQKGEQS